MNYNFDKAANNLKDFEKYLRRVDDNVSVKYLEGYPKGEPNTTYLHISFNYEGFGVIEINEWSNFIMLETGYGKEKESLNQLEQLKLEEIKDLYSSYLDPVERDFGYEFLEKFEGIMFYRKILEPNGYRKDECFVIIDNHEVLSAYKDNKLIDYEEIEDYIEEDLIELGVLNNDSLDTNESQLMKKVKSKKLVVVNKSDEIMHKMVNINNYIDEINSKGFIIDLEISDVKNINSINQKLLNYSNLNKKDKEKLKEEICILEIHLNNILNRKPDKNDKELSMSVLNRMLMKEIH